MRHTVKGQRSYSTCAVVEHVLFAQSSLTETLCCSRFVLKPVCPRLLPNTAIVLNKPPRVAHLDRRLGPRPRPFPRAHPLRRPASLPTPRYLPASLPPHAHTRHLPASSMLPSELLELIRHEIHAEMQAQQAALAPISRNKQRTANLSPHPNPTDIRY